MVSEKKCGIFIVLTLLIVLLSSIAYGVSANLIYSANAVAKKDIRISMVNQEPDPVEPGKYVTVKFKLENWGSEATAPLVLGIKPLYPFTLLDGYEYEQQVGNLNSRQKGEDSIIVEWKLKVDKDAAEGDNELVVYYKELTGLQAKVIYEDKFDVNIRTSDTILSVEKIATEPKEIQPGQEANLKITLRNLGDSFIKDVNVALGLSSSGITTLGSTNKQIIPMIDGKETKEVVFRIVPSLTANIGIYNIPLNLSFKDNLNNAYTQQSDFGLQLTSPIKYVIVVDSTEIKTSNSNGEVSLKISNPGLSNIKFLTAELKQSKQYEILSASTVYVGNVDSDDFESITYKLHVNNDENGQVKLRILLAYMDDYNNKYNAEEEINLQVYSDKVAKKYGLIPSSGNGGIVIILIIVIAGVWYYFYRRKKKRLEREQQKLSGKSK